MRRSLLLYLCLHVQVNVTNEKTVSINYCRLSICMPGIERNDNEKSLTRHSHILFLISDYLSFLHVIYLIERV